MDNETHAMREKMIQPPSFNIKKYATHHNSSHPRAERKQTGISARQQRKRKQRLNRAIRALQVQKGTKGA